MQNTPKEIIWMGNSKKMLLGFPMEVKRLMGQALYFAQMGGRHPSTKMMKGLGSGVYEVLDGHRTDTFRSVYTIQFTEKIYILPDFRRKRS